MPTETQTEDEEIDRLDTGIRILLTVLFFIIARVVSIVLIVVILFELAFTLITQKQPSGEVKRFANRALSYLVTLMRYLTYNDAQLPFTFREFPAELDLTSPLDPSGYRNAD